MISILIDYLIDWVISWYLDVMDTVADAVFVLGQPFRAEVVGLSDLSNLTLVFSDSNVNPNPNFHFRKRRRPWIPWNRQNWRAWQIVFRYVPLPFFEFSWYSRDRSKMCGRAEVRSQQVPRDISTMSFLWLLHIGLLRRRYFERWSILSEQAMEELHFQLIRFRLAICHWSCRGLQCRNESSVSRN